MQLAASPDVLNATTPCNRDNELARGIKHDYRRIYTEAREREQVARDATERLRHAAAPLRLPNGDLVRAEQGLVITERRHGYREEVEIRAGRIRFVNTDLRGRLVIVELEGDNISYNDGRNHTRYSLKNGLPHQHITNRFGTSFTQVYRDGSTSSVSQPLQGEPRYFRSEAARIAG